MSIGGELPFRVPALSTGFCNALPILTGSEYVVVICQHCCVVPTWGRGMAEWRLGAICQGQFALSSISSEGWGTLFLLSGSLPHRKVGQPRATSAPHWFVTAETPV